jgi:transcriptional regulator with XRE-family HTH domain
MKHRQEMQLRHTMAGIDRDLLATYVRNKMDDDKLSLRKAADLAHCSPATLSRLLSGSGSGYVPDTATVSAIAKWLNKPLSDFEPKMRPSQKSLADVEVHLHALPDLSHDDARAIMSVVKLLYEQKRDRTPKKK